MLLAQIQLNAVTHEYGVGPLLEKLHEGPGHGQRDQPEENGHENGRLEFTAVGFDGGDEEVADYGADGDDEGGADVDEEFGGAVADEELGAAAHHEVEGLLGGGAEVFARYRDHYVGVLGEETDQSLEAGDQARTALYQEVGRLALSQT